jgi:chromate transporter
MFATMIGYNAAAAAGLNKAAGGALMTLGIFLPAFSFPVLGHDFFERVAKQRGGVAHFLDGMTASVVGLVAVTGCQLLRTAVRPGQPIDAIIFLASFLALYSKPFATPWAPMVIILLVGHAGYILYS